MHLHRSALTGALLGLLVSLAVWEAPQRTFPGGSSTAGPDAGGELLLLFVISLPWSLLVWGAGVGAVALQGHDGLPVPLFSLMPIVAGAGWGWFAAWIRHRRTLRALVVGDQRTPRPDRAGVDP